ncbi:MAG TPA: hypothetical protein DDY20_03595 [Desulfobulbaceae bacterium]|nr:hypothetical protein [Desulfobulbaceae bacterium]
MKHLLLCRHAKSSWKDGTLADFDRPLNGRGRQNAPEMGRRLRRRGVQPDLVVTSPARRALGTAKLLASECGVLKKNILVLDSLYDSYPAKLLLFIQSLDDRLGTVLLVGHNPEITILANILGNLGIENVPTCGIVALDFPVGSWAEVDEEGATLNFLDYPRKEEK